MVAQTNRMNEQFREAIERPAELVKEYPLASMLLMFGMGLGVGVVVSSAICSSLTEMDVHESTMAEKLKKQVYDALSNVLSPSTLRQIQSYTG
jgi:fructoselysine-6-P-deglycase FrlB-like protein